MKHTTLSIVPGLSVQTRRGESDLDHRGRPRSVAAGAIGWVTSLSHTDDSGVATWNVGFPGGLWVALTTPELQDPDQYRLAEPDSLRELALRIKYGYEVEEHSMLADELIGVATTLTEGHDEIIKAVDRAEEGRALARRTEALMTALKSSASPDDPRWHRGGELLELLEDLVAYSR